MALCKGQAFVYLCWGVHNVILIVDMKLGAGTEIVVGIQVGAEVVDENLDAGIGIEIGDEAVVGFEAVVVIEAVTGNETEVVNVTLSRSEYK